MQFLIYSKAVQMGVHDSANSLQGVHPQAVNKQPAGPGCCLSHCCMVGKDLGGQFATCAAHAKEGPPATAVHAVGVRGAGHCHHLSHTTGKANCCHWGPLRGVEQPCVTITAHSARGKGCHKPPTGGGGEAGQCATSVAHSVQLMLCVAWHSGPMLGLRPHQSQTTLI